jgi:hypothetical protein
LDELPWTSLDRQLVHPRRLRGSCRTPRPTPRGQAGCTGPGDRVDPLEQEDRAGGGEIVEAVGHGDAPAAAQLDRQRRGSVEGRGRRERLDERESGPVAEPLPPAMEGRTRDLAAGARPHGGQPGAVEVTEDRGPSVMGCRHDPSVVEGTASGKTGLVERTPKSHPWLRASVMPPHSPEDVPGVNVGAFGRAVPPTAAPADLGGPGADSQALRSGCVRAAPFAKNATASGAKGPSVRRSGSPASARSGAG